MTHPIIVIGAGLAGWTTVREFRKLDPTAPVVLITADSGDFYAKPTLSNAYAQKRSPAQLVSTSAEKMVDTLKVTLLQHTRVTGIDTAARRVQTAQGAFDYSQLVLATGAQPIRVPLQGDAADQVVSVNSLDDFSTFSARVASASSYQNESDPGTSPTPVRVVIMGAGLIGCEFANDLAGAGMQVSVVDPSPRPLAALLPEGASTELQAALSNLGVQWHFGQTVVAVNQAGAGLGATLSQGDTLAADVVLSAVGLRADTRLAQAAGIACERGIVVDAHLQTSAEGVYALGDSAQYDSADKRTLPYVMPIMNAAKALAATLAGKPTPVVFPLMPVAIKTPALPLVVSPAPPKDAGDWCNPEPGVWQYRDSAQVQRGFVLSGGQTARRMEQSKQTLP